jgi:TLD
MDPRLVQFITNFLFGPPSSRSPHVEFQRFAELYVFCVRGSIDELVGMLMSSLGYPNNESVEIAYPLLKEYVEAVVGSYMRAIKGMNAPPYQSWDDSGIAMCKESVQKLAEGLCFDAVQRNTQKVSRAEAESWLQKSPTFLKMLKTVFTNLYNYRAVREDDKKAAPPQLQLDPGTELLPICEDHKNKKEFPPLIDLAQIVFLNTNLPLALQNEWRFLFSSQIHGESFSTMLGKISNQGPTVLLIEDSNGYVFGGFATVSWALSPNFVGDETGFLFTTKPKMRCFPTTGYNDHYQYLNLHQQTMPNGLGMGGQHNFWGLWLDSEYGLGESAESCTTYQGYTQLSATKNFKVRNIEVWAVGPVPKVDSDEEDGGSPKGKSVLDGNTEAKALLKIAGREAHSDGYREEPPL